jgi:NDP-sugar pyrophosphorylase family protein
MGTAGALRLAFPKLFPAAGSNVSGKNENVLVLNGDSYCAAGLSRFDKFHEQHGAKISLVLTQVQDASRFGKVELAANHQINSFCEKQLFAGKGWINAGIYLINTQQIEEIPAGRAVSIEREMFPRWLHRGVLFGYCEDASFLDIGAPESYGRAELFLSRLNTDCTVPAAQAKCA